MTFEPPFIIIRIYGTGAENDRFLQRLFFAQRKYPGLVDEIWFSGNSLAGSEENGKFIQQNLPYRETCRQLGIRFSFQQGVTLNHGPDFMPHPGFSDEDWAVDWNGKILQGKLCATSPRAYQFNYETAKQMMSALQPDSYWIDDDFRIYPARGMNCFCPRCRRLFNEQYHHDYTLEQMHRLLETDHDAKAGQFRAEWADFNASNLGKAAEAFRQAADEVAPECFLGYQAVWSNVRYNGIDFAPILKSLSGQGRRLSGIRPGAQYYADMDQLQFTRKILDVQREAARCRTLGCVGQICYEAENWPHVAALKNPVAMMTECAQMLAGGADSLALYWGSDKNSEPEELWDYFFETLHEWKPYLLAVRDSVQDSSPSGLAVFRGSDVFQSADWIGSLADSEEKMMRNALPLTVMDAFPEVYVLESDAAVEQLSEKDLPCCFAKTVLMDAGAFRKLSEKFPDLLFLKKIRMEAPAGASEVFADKHFATNTESVFYPLASDVKTFSGISGHPGSCGTCVIPTEFGGSVVLTQGLNLTCLWTGYRRKAVLDALDSLLGNGLSVRLNTAGFSVTVTGNRNADGKTVSCFLLNRGLGRTLPLEVSLRNPASGEYTLFRGGKEPVKLVPVRRTANELVFQLPPLEGFESAIIGKGLPATPER